MASEVVKKASKLPAPLSTSYSLLPKRLLSHKWVVTSAKSCLKQLGCKLKSQTFSVVLPQNNMEFGDHHHLISKWCLRLEHVPQTSSMSPESIFQCNISSKTTYKVSIPKCTFSLFHSDQEEPILQHSESVIQYTLREYESVCCSWKFLYKDFDKHIHNGTLTIQMDATLYCHVEALGEPESSPKFDNIVMGMKMMFNDKLFTDLTIKCGGEEFKVHKAVLDSQSPVFRRMLESEMKEQRTNVIEITDVNPQVMSDLLAYLYTGDAPSMDALANKLLVVANKYALSQLFEICENKLKTEINDTNFIDLLIFADLHNAASLKRTCLIFICCNIPSIYNSGRWKEFKQNCEEHLSLLMEILEFLP